MFGYNIDDKIKASKVLKDGYGQCNTKGILLMALLRAKHIPCRIHGFMIDKLLQKGAMTGLVYKLAPKEVLHSYVEVYYNCSNTYIQKEGIVKDFGIYDNPDDLLLHHHQNISFIKKLAYQFIGRKKMNHNVKKIRKLNKNK